MGYEKGLSCKRRLMGENVHTLMYHPALCWSVKLMHHPSLYWSVHTLMHQPALYWSVYTLMHYPASAGQNTQYCNTLTSTGEYTH